MGQPKTNVMRILEQKKVPYTAHEYPHGKEAVDGLTVDQIRQIYTARLIEWGQVGGKEGLLIKAYQRPQNSGSQTAMENLVMQGVALSGADPAYITDGMGDLISQVGDFENGPAALGYSYLYYVEGMYKSGEVKVLSVDGIAPTEELKEELLSYCASHIAKYAMPREVEFRTELPKTLVGKVAYRVLEEEELRKYAQQQ